MYQSALPLFSFSQNRKGFSQNNCYHVYVATKETERWCEGVRKNNSGQY